MDAFDWIEENLEPEWQADGSRLYEGMDSQSNHSLPLIHQPFDAGQRAHWSDRGSAHDFVAATGGGRLLDLGPGDGWPSLIVAPYVEEVHGIDASPGLVDIQRENARRLGITNVTFHVIRPGERFPFEDETFTGAMASSSLEQTPDPRATLLEIRRVLEPGGRLRTFYEALERYRGRERPAWLMGLENGTSLLFLSDYRIDEERARHVRLHLELPAPEVLRGLGLKGEELEAGEIEPVALAKLRSAIADIRGCELSHPSGPTWAAYMRDAGFSDVRGTRSGQTYAARVFDSLDASERPQDLAGVDALLRPVIPAVVEQDAPLERDPMITARR